MFTYRVSVFVSVVTCLYIRACSSYRILGVFPMPAPSHYFLGNNLLKGLAEAGHDITIIAPFSEKHPPENGSWREIKLDGMESFMKAQMKKINFTSQMMNANPFEMLTKMIRITKTIAEMSINHTNVQQLMASNEKFDAVIVAEFMMDALKAFARKFDAHLMSFSNHGALNWYYSNIGLQIPPSVFPEALLALPAKMNFFQRVKNTIVHVVIKTFITYILFPAQEELVAKYFPDSPPLRDIVENVSLAIVNSHISLNIPQAKIPIMVEVGGMHVKPPKPLPNDLQILLDNAKNGVIYFSVGSNFQSEDLPPNAIEDILKTFSKRKELILWKWGQDTLPGKPTNVHIGKWFPQQDILAHPNVKLFITHSGFLSTTETIYYGVPIVSVPLGADQKMNAISASQEGYGIPVFLDTFSEEAFGAAIEEVITNSKYRETVKAKSKIFHDRQRPPIQDAVYWVEYVIRHNGAKHLRVPSMELTWYQYYLIDVIGFVALSLLIILYILKKLTYWLVRKCLCRRSKVKTS